MGRRSHLSKEERLVVQVGLESRRKISEIAKELNRSKSCISKEIHLNTDPDFGFYCYLRADNLSRERQSQSRVRDYKINKIPKEIIDRLFTDYMGVHELSPDDAAYKLRMEDEYRVSYSTIYRYVNRDRFQNGKLYKYLPRKGKRHKKAQFVRVKIKDKTTIDLRPDKSMLLLEAGHYEIDTIYGKDQESFLLTIVDIATMYTIMIKMDNKAAATVEEALIHLFNTTMLPLKSITSDNGCEFACHTKIKNENTNGLIRRFLPKGSDFNLVSEDRIRFIQNSLNGRYRKRINRMTPANLMVDMVQQAA